MVIGLVFENVLWCYIFVKFNVSKMIVVLLKLGLIVIILLIQDKHLQKKSGCHGGPEA